VTVSGGIETLPRLTIRAVDVRAVDVPLARPHQTASGVLASAPLVLIDLLTEEGVAGRSYVFCYTPAALVPVARLVANIGAWLTGDAVAPLALERKVQGRLRLLGPQGLTGIAAAGLDMAAWDALARAAGLPLARLLGGDLRPFPAYHSLGMSGEARAGEEVQESVEAGFRAIKIKFGYPDLRDDLAVIRAIRRAVGDDILLMVDYNQTLTVPEALRRLRALDDLGLGWVEEPTTADDFAGHAQISREARTPIQLGENWWGTHDMAKALAAGASDLAMLDAMKIGGVTGWLRAAALAEPGGLPVSSHLFSEISAHLLAVSPTAHWLEYADWADPILQEPLRVSAGHAHPSATPGSGLAWHEEHVRRYRVE
jgi:mandelate racemase